MRSAEQVELERQHVQREDTGCSRKGGTPTKQLLVKLAQKEHCSSYRRQRASQGHARAFGPCSAAEGALDLQARAKLGNYVG